MLIISSLSEWRGKNSLFIISFFGANLPHVRTSSVPRPASAPNRSKRYPPFLMMGATIPFIARYRKEATGSLDEVALTTIRDTIARHKELTDRKAAILKSLEERALLTEALKSAIDKASTATALEDLYQQYRPKKRTRAMIARRRGLNPCQADDECCHRSITSQKIAPTGSRKIYH